MEIVKINSNELSKVEENSLNSDQLSFLFKKTPKIFTYTRPAKGGGVWTYVTGSYIKKVLNLIFGWDWDFEIQEYKYDLTIKQVFVIGKLTCRTNGKTIIKNQFGRKDIICKKGTDIPLDLGNDLKAAATDALKKCANEFGIANDIYAPNEFREIKITESKVLSELLPNTDSWSNAISAIKNGYTIEQIKSKYSISKETEKTLLDEAI